MLPQPLTVFVSKGEPDPLEIPVASPAGMAILKLISWIHRDSDLRRKDANDFAYLLNRYETIPHVSEQLYTGSLVENYDWDLTLAGAHLLGSDARAIAGEASVRQIVRLTYGEFSNRTLERLNEEMCTNIEHQYERYGELVQAFLSGFMEK